MLKSILILIFLTAISISVFSQTDTLRIHTSAICETCKKTLENDLSFERGVKKATLDIDSKILTVVYLPEKTNPEKIRKAITKSGYDADSLPADPKAYKHLPDCCKKESIK